MESKAKQKSISLWADSVTMPKFESLSGEHKTDVLIIGGGMAGILCAYFLKQQNVDYILLEGKRIGGGVTGNTTAKVTAQHGAIYSDLLKTGGAEKTGMYLKANQAAVEKFKELSALYPCDFEEKSAYVYSLYDYEKIRRELYTLQKLGFPAFFAQNLPLPLDIAGAMEFQKQGQFHPLKFLSGIAKELRIYENSYVHRLEDHTVYTENGQVTAKKIIIATHFPFLNRHGSYFLKLYQHRSYVIALENGGNIHGMYVDEVQEGMSFRNYGELLLLGGGDHRTGKAGGKWWELRDFVKANYPQAKEVYHWATQDCMSLDNVPYIGVYSAGTPDLLVATGFNKWGMTSSMVSAMILSDLAQERKNEFAPVFSPQRSILKPQLFLNTAETLVNFISPTPKRCTHLGCALRWNGTEDSWDCPCHGSRFGRDGSVLDNPAMKPKKGGL